jgi:hypothetical protein
MTVTEEKLLPEDEEDDEDDVVHQKLSKGGTVSSAYNQNSTEFNSIFLYFIFLIILVCLFSLNIVE